MSIGRYWQHLALEADAVVVSHGTLILLAQNVIQMAADPRHEGRTFLHCRLPKLGVEGGAIHLLQIPVGRPKQGDARCCEFLGQPPLMGAKRPLAAASCLGE
jgi:hypothetical protein